MLIDTHCHLVNEDYDIKQVIKNANVSGVEYLVVSGSSREDNRLNLELLDKYDNLFLSVGYHPDMASSVTEEDYSYLEECLMNDKNNRIVAIGEIGLDYHYGKENMEHQKKLFRRQLDIAQKYNKPVVIHTRDAFLDTYNVLKEYKLTGIIHCFSGSLESANMYINLGYYLGIGGVVTFKNSKLKDVIKEIGLDRVVFETDSPYLSPFRGEKNEPCNVKYICEYTANMLDLTYNDVAEKTTSNAIKIFNLKEENLSGN